MATRLQCAVPPRGASQATPRPGLVTAKPKFALLALSLAAALAGCPKQDASTPAADAAKPDAPAQPQFTLDEASSPRRSASRRTTSTRPNACADFNGYVNGKWGGVEPDPGDRSWGAFDALAETLAVGAAPAGRGSGGGEEPDRRRQDRRRLLGQRHGRGQDRAAGHRPGKPMLAQVDALTDTASIADYIRATAAKGQNVLFDFGPKRTSKKFVDEHRLRHPGRLACQRGYYFDKDKADKPRRLPGAHRQGARTGRRDRGRRGQAGEGRDRVRDAAGQGKCRRNRPTTWRCTTTRPRPADADKLTPNFPWTKFFQAQGRGNAEDVLAGDAEVPRGSGQDALADTPASVEVPYFRFHLIDGASPYLSKAFADENYDFYSKTMRGQNRRSALEARARRDGRGRSAKAFWPGIRAGRVPGRFQGEDGTLVQNLGTALKARIENPTG